MQVTLHKDNMSKNETFSVQFRHACKVNNYTLNHTLNFGYNNSF